MTPKQRLSYRLILRAAAILLACVGFTACRAAPENTVPNINDVVATGMVGTQHAWALGTIVSATQAALSGQATPAPPALMPSLTPAAAAADAAAAGGPCAGSQPGKRAYQDQAEGYCLFYPENFFVNKPLGGGVEFMGPALDKSSQPLRAYINILRKERVNGRTLDEIALDIWKDSRSTYHLSNIQLGGQDALAAEGLQIGEAGWEVKQVLITHNGFVYLISLSPFDSTPPFDSALPDAQRFWNLAASSFAFR